MAELPAPPSLLDEVNPRLVVAVTRSQKRKREEEQALVSVSSLFGAPSFSPAGARCSLWTGTGFARAENNNAWSDALRMRCLPDVYSSRYDVLV